MKKLLIVAHCPSENTKNLRNAAVKGSQDPRISGVEVVVKTPFDSDIKDIFWANAILLGTTENLGYMSGALKDFFDRTYNQALGNTDGLPYAVYIRAGMDGTGTRRSITSITTGLRWREVQAPLIFKGQWKNEFLSDLRELGMSMAAGLESGIF
ncbi:MAG: flavodoxin family protein [Rhodospirillaceae bacterium]|nr:flavodoxin family protein [Rhodospirillaceae bacterium]MBT7733236.1 flavodoxin family protein [Rhodospirillaceae bacterium]